MARTRLLLFLFAFFVPSPAGASGEVIVLFPPDLTLATDPAIKVYVFRAGGEGSVPLRVNGREADPVEGNIFLSGEVRLQPGMNTLEIAGKTIRVYDLPGAPRDRYRLAGEGEKAPLVFRSYRFHAAIGEGCGTCHTLHGPLGEECTGCHKVETGRLAVMKDLRKACYGCHDDLEKAGGEENRTVHDPVKGGECTVCHDPHFSSEPKLMRSERICLECHDAFSEGETVHYPVKEGKCTACHGPHAGATPKLLVRAGNALCLGCHDASHAAHRAAEVKGRTTQVPPDFPREEDQLACTGCHFPHRSPERRLLRMPQGKLCQTCHPI